MAELARVALLASALEPVSADAIRVEAPMGRVGYMRKVACVAEMTPPELVVSARLGTPWPGLVDEGDRGRDDEFVQKVAVGAVAASTRRVEEFAREDLDIESLGRRPRGGIRVHAAVSDVADANSLCAVVAVWAIALEVELALSRWGQ